jgi:hypothetical protein
LPHDGVHHQVRGVGFYHRGRAGLADDVRLPRGLAGGVVQAGRGPTMSQPSFADAMAEKYGAPV